MSSVLYISPFASPTGSPLGSPLAARLASSIAFSNSRVSFTNDAVTELARETETEDSLETETSILDTIDQLLRQVTPSPPPPPPPRTMVMFPRPPPPIVVPRSPPTANRRRAYAVVQLPSGGFSYRPNSERFFPRAISPSRGSVQGRRPRQQRVPRQIRELCESQSAAAVPSALSTIHFDETMAAPEGRCVICLEIFCNTTVVFVPCQPAGRAFKDHMFHNQCLRRWIDIERYHGRPRSCPICRFKF